MRRAGRRGKIKIKKTPLGRLITNLQTRFFEAPV
jgi:hypothetical protein